MVHAARTLLLLAAAARAASALPPPPAGTASGALATLSRVFSRDASAAFAVELVAGAACATVSGGGGGARVRVAARTAVDAVAAVAQYARAAFNASFAWADAGGTTLGSMPPAGAPLPPPAGGALTLCRRVNYTYYQNVVQSSYSNVWWTAARWQAEVDWMALHGINIALAYGGQEALFRDVYKSLGLGDAALGAFFNGPAFLSWSRGQGQAGVGGPLPAWWYAQQLALNQAVVGMMSAVGVAPVLPVFQGNVPAGLKELFPRANISDGWVDVFDPLFGVIQDRYMAALLAAYPSAMTTSFYEGDGLFASGRPPWGEHGGSFGGARAWAAGAHVAPSPEARARAAAAYSSFAKHDADAVWVYQSWIWRGFESDSDLSYMSGWCAGVPTGRLFLLDQTAERVPIWAKFNNASFFGQPFAWLSMNNMGGNVGLVGAFDWVAAGVAAAAAAGGALAAVGIDPEGINTNPAYWEYTLAATWGAGAGGTAGVAPAAWLADYGVRRCGRDAAGVREAYAALATTVFSPAQPNDEHHLVYCGTAYPLRGGGNSWDKELSMLRPTFYAAAALARVWALLLAAAHACDAPVTYDLIDVAREYVSLFPCVAAHDALNSAATRPAVAAANASLVAVLTDLDALLGSVAGFSTGAWVRDARALGEAAGAPAADVDLLEWNARAQISTWFPTPPAPTNGLYDYANKQWAGITRDYYLRRYTLLAVRADAALAAGAPVDAKAFAGDLAALGAAWTTATAPTYPAEPVGDAVALAQAAYDKYAAAA